MREFRRIITRGAFGFVHHSNVTAYPWKDHRTIPRNFMSKEIFTHSVFTMVYNRRSVYIRSRWTRSGLLFIISKERASLARIVHGCGMPRADSEDWMITSMPEADDDPEEGER
jgi:hypothetical protein